MSIDLLEGLPSRIRLLEVGPRDGLQNQSRIVPVHEKAAWIRRLIASGLKEIEVTSFVHPSWIPQLADNRELLTLLEDELKRENGAKLSALVPNLRGLENALEGGLRHIALFTAASETFNQKNINCGIAGAFRRFEKVFARIEGENVGVRGYVSTCFGCPYEGTVDAARVVEVAKQLYTMGATEIAISDTTGVADPVGIQRVVEACAAEVPLEHLALHLHDTRGLALANTLVGLKLGITSFDASSGGLGGCPYAPGAAGNLATEDLLTLLDGLGIETGVDLEALVEANLWFETHFSTSFPGRVLSSCRSRS